MRKLLLAAGFTLLLASPAQAQTQITIDCTAVTVRFQTSIQPDSASVEIVSNAGTETHPVTLTQGGTDVVTFPLDGQNGEVVAVNVTIVHAGIPNVTSATKTLEGCAVPSPSPSPSPLPVESPVIVAPPTLTPPPPVEPEEPVEEEAESSTVTRTSTPELPAELAFTGPGQIIGLFFAALGLLAVGAGLVALSRKRQARIRRLAISRDLLDSGFLQAAVQNIERGFREAQTR